MRQKNAPSAAEASEAQEIGDRDTTTGYEFHAVWSVKFAGFDQEIRVVCIDGATVDEIERHLATKFPGSVVERLRPAGAH